MIGKRSTTQIRKIIKSCIVGSGKDQRALESTKKRSLGWEMNSSVKNTETSTTINYGPSEVIAYAYYHMNGRFVILRRILGEIQKLMPNFTPTRILDFGCGPGVGACVVVDIWKVQMFRFTPSLLVHSHHSFRYYF